VNVPGRPSKKYAVDSIPIKAFSHSPPGSAWYVLSACLGNCPTSVITYTLKDESEVAHRENVPLRVFEINFDRDAYAGMS
jgi:hypothetical protein